MLDFDKGMLEALIVENHDTKNDLAVALGISKSRLYQVFSGKGKFTLDQVRIMTKRYHIPPKWVWAVFLFPGEIPED